MRKQITLIVSICILFMLVACNQNSNSDWYDTRDEAVKIGLKEEGINKLDLLSVEEYKDETIVFYQHGNALGVASITESQEGYRWFRSSPYLGFDVTGDIPYTTASFNYETETGVQVPILYGQLFDGTVQTVDLDNIEGINEVQLLENSSFFFAFLEEPLVSLNRDTKK